MLPRQRKTSTTDENPFPQMDSKPRSQHSDSCKLMP